MIERRLRLAAVEMAVAEAGAGGRPLLAVHGFTGAKEDFTPWLDRLAARGWHAVAPDLRGHGHTSKPADEGAYSVGALAGDLLDLLDALGWPRCAVLGHSMGGVIAQRLALEAPGRLEALVLMDTFHGPLVLDGGVHELAVGTVRAEGMAGLLEGMKALAATGELPLSSDADRRLREDPAYVAFCDAKLLATAPAAYCGLLAAMHHEPDRLDALADAVRDVPTLVLVGEQDTELVPEARRLADQLPAAVLAVVPGAGHCPQFEAPDAWWAALTGFLDRITSGSTIGGS